jgi:hypothetical protein
MERIIEHIECLLLQHDCVIIPDFGGFVLQSVSAVYKGEEHAYLPAHKEIVFNPTLTHNDGLLMESYMQAYRVDFAKAQQLVRRDVTDMKHRLDDDAELPFGVVGLFRKEDERLLFIPGKNSEKQFSTQSYGLPVFHYLPLSARRPAGSSASEQHATPISEEKPDRTKKQSDRVVYHIPVTRMFLQVIGVAAAAVFLFFLISTPVGDVNNASYSAGFVPPEIMPKKTVEEIIADAFSIVDSASAISSAEADNTSNLPESPSPLPPQAPTPQASPSQVQAPTQTPIPVPAPTPAATEPAETTDSRSTTASGTTTNHPSTETSASSSASVKDATAAQAISTNETAKYYVIIASFDTKAQAQEHINSLKGTKEADTAQILAKDGRMRVYARQFTTEKSAQSYLKQIRQNPQHRQAWLYKAR